MQQEEKELTAKTDKVETQEQSNHSPFIAFVMAMMSFPIFMLVGLIGGYVVILLLFLWAAAIIIGIKGVSRAKALNRNVASAKVLLWTDFILIILFIVTPMFFMGRPHSRLAIRAMSMTQLNGLGKAIELYQETNEGQLPTDVGLLVDEGMISVKSFIYPGSDSEVKVVNGRLEGDPSYVIFLDDKFKDKSDAIRAHEKIRFADKKNNIAILTVGGSVKKMTIDELNKQLIEEGRPPAE